MIHKRKKKEIWYPFEQISTLTTYLSKLFIIKSFNVDDESVQSRLLICMEMYIKHIKMLRIYSITLLYIYFLCSMCLENYFNVFMHENHIEVRCFEQMIFSVSKFEHIYLYNVLREMIHFSIMSRHIIHTNNTYMHIE